jgi:hypothetical protein
VAHVFGLVSLLQDPVNHISEDSNGCLDTPFGTMHHAPCHRPFIFSYIFPLLSFTAYFISHFSLLVLGTVPPGSTISHGLLPEPYPFLLPHFIILFSYFATCSTLEKKRVISPEMSEYFYQATQSYISKALSIGGVFFLLPLERKKSNFLACAALSKDIKSSGRSCRLWTTGVRIAIILHIPNMLSI